MIKTVIYAVLLALVIRTVAFEPFNIPSGSMKPTLLVGDYLFVSKFSYGYSQHALPLSSYLPSALFSGRIFFRDPERGDVVVFKLPTDNKTDYIKRIIGLPGDRVQVKGGRLHINGKIVPRQPVEDYVDIVSVRNRRAYKQFIETLPNGRKHFILEARDDAEYDNTREFVVPAGNYFAMGDNRDNSSDSRASVGFVPAENLVGRADRLFFSTDGTARFWEVWKWPSATRFSRFFQAVSP
jgi:signal peptidase I